MPPRRPGGVRARSPPTTAAKLRDHRSGYRPNVRRESRPHMRGGASPLPEDRSHRAVDRSSYRTIDGVRRRSRSLEGRDYSSRYADDRNDGQLEWRYLSPDLPPDSYAHRAATTVNNDYRDKRPSGPDDRGMLNKKSLRAEDGSFRTLYSLPPESGHPTDHTSLESGKFGGAYPSIAADGGYPRLRDRIYPTKLPERESYDGGRSSYYLKDSSYSIPTSSEPRAFGSLSASLPKDDFVASYPSGRFDASDSKYKDPLDCDAYNRLPLHQSTNGISLHLKDIDPYQGASQNPNRDISYDYKYSELSKRDMGGSGVEPDELYQRLKPTPSEDYPRRDFTRSGFLGSAGARAVGVGNENPGKSYKILRDSSLWGHRPRHEENASKYHEAERPPLAKDRHGEFMDSRSTHFDLRSKPSEGREISHYGRYYGFGRDSGPILGYEEGGESPQKVEYDQKMYGNEVDHPTRLVGYGVEDSYFRRMTRRYMLDEINRQGEGSSLPLNCSTFGTAEELNLEDDVWDSNDRKEPLPYKRTIFGRGKDRLQRTTFNNSPTLPEDEWMPDQEWMHEHSFHGARGVINRRGARLGRSNFLKKFSLVRRKEFHKPYKYHKRALKDRLDNASTPNEDPEEVAEPTVVKREPVEGSDEFKQLLQKAFLRFSKQLNENAFQQRKYKEQGKGGNLGCCVCGRDSKEFGDMHNLITHAFHSQKGLRSDHLGLHKALCVMMGWNSLVSPDMSKKYQIMASTEAADLKEDLILWPPIVIVHNSSIGNKDSNAREVVTNEKMEEILREMEFDMGKTKVCRGKPANHSIVLVKFVPTLSGLQEAERLHRYYAENKRGRKEWWQIAMRDSGDDVNDKGADPQGKRNVEQLLYGYLAIADSLANLDHESKKRSLVKSKKEITAIADATISSE